MQSTILEKKYAKIFIFVLVNEKLTKTRRPFSIYRDFTLGNGFQYILTSFTVHLGTKKLFFKNYKLDFLQIIAIMWKTSWTSPHAHRTCARDLFSFLSLQINYFERREMFYDAMWG